MTLVRRFAAAAALTLLAAACTSADDAAVETTTPPASSTTTTSTTAAPSASLDVDRLVVINDDSQVVTMNRDGSDVVVLSEEGDVPFQPVWSPGGRDVAYASRAESPEFVVTDATGGSRRAADSFAASFYHYWSPDGTRLGSLRNGANGLAFEVISVDGDSIGVEEIDNGQPFYFSWSPAGDRAVAHVGADRLDLIDGAGSSEPLGSEPGAFQAPQWTPAGIYAAIRRGGGQEIVQIDDSGDVVAVASADGGVIFSASPSGGLVAAQTFVEGDSGVSVALLADPLPPNRLVVIDVESGTITPVLDRPAVAFFWSPVFDRLLVLAAAEEAGFLTWSIWEDGELSDGPTFRPAVQWVAEFLPFYDQYSQSVALWSPDASAYAFPGAIDGDAGIWVAPVGAGAPKVISSGSWVAWSPN